MDASARVRLVADPSRCRHSRKRSRIWRSDLRRLRGKVAEDRVALVVFSGDLDRVLASFIIATGAAAMASR